MSDDCPPPLKRSSHSYVSSDSLPDSVYTCHHCAINTLSVTQLEKQLKHLESAYSTLQTAYKHKCIEFEEMTIHYDTVIDQKCRELTELQDGLNAIFFNNVTRRQKSNSISTPSLVRNGSLTLNNAPNNNLNFLFRQRSITPEPSTTIDITAAESTQIPLFDPSRGPTSNINNINNRNKTKNIQNISGRTAFSKQTHINSNEVSYPYVNRLMSRSNKHIKSLAPITGVLSEIPSVETVHDVWNCLSVNRILDYLRQYKDESIQFERVYRDKITDVLNDYHHIIMEHCHEYNEIYSLLPLYLKCNISKCKQFEEQKQKENGRRRVIGDIMDSIHIYICHSYHIGYRVMNNKWLKPNELSARHDLLRKIRGTQCNRFQTNNVDKISTFYDHNDVSMVQRRNYAFGERFYYWNEYKQHEMYVEAKAKDLKHEMMDYFSIQEYQCILSKAKELIKTDHAKQIKVLVGVDKYGLHSDEALQLENIMVVFVYCGYDKLCSSFCSTFRRITDNESIVSMKKRNATYYWLSRILRETVECYGDKMVDTTIKKYYHGTSHLIFDLFVVKLFAPTSASTSIDVATIFCGNDGIIVEFTQYSPHLTYFNCSWISAFAGEDERLFFGGNGAVQIVNIRLIKTNTNCRYYISAIRSFHCFLRASELRCDYDDEEEDKENDEVIIKALIDEYLKVEMNHLPQYINNVFGMFCKRRKEIYIDIDDMYQCYDAFVSIFWTDIDNLLRFDKMVKLFPNAVKITIIYNDDDGDGQYNEIDEQYLHSLLVILQSIHEMYEHHISLYSICIKNVKYYDAFLISRVQFKAKLHKIGWKLYIEEVLDLNHDHCEHWSFLRIKQEDSVIDKLSKLQLV